MAGKIIHAIQDGQGSLLARYRAMTTGDAGWGFLIRFELCMLLFRNVPGALGLFLRKIFFPGLFGACGRGVLFGTGLTVRHPRAIQLGAGVVIDDHVVLDAKGAGAGKGICIGNRVFLSRNVILGCKNGRIEIGDEVSIGPHSTIHSVEESEVRIGRDVVIAAYVYVIGAPNYKTRRGPTPMAKQGFETGRGVTVGNDVWIGAAAVLCDGAAVGEGAIVGAQSLVRGVLPPYSIAYGTPALVRGQRSEAAAGKGPA